MAKRRLKISDNFKVNHLAPTQTFGYRVISKYFYPIKKFRSNYYFRDRCTDNKWKFYLFNRPWNLLLKYTFVSRIRSSVLAQSTRNCNLRWRLRKYTLCQKAKIIYLCTFVRQEQSSHNARDISERDNISSRDPHQVLKEKFIHLTILSDYEVNFSYSLQNCDSH